MTTPVENRWDWNAYLTNGPSGADISPEIRLLDFIAALRRKGASEYLCKRVERIRCDMSLIFEQCECTSTDDHLERVSKIEERKRRVQRVLCWIAQITKNILSENDPK